MWNDTHKPPEGTANPLEVPRGPQDTRAIEGALSAKTEKRPDPEVSGWGSKEWGGGARKGEAGGAGR